MKVTLALPTGLPQVSVTWTTSGEPNALATWADWGEPETIVMEFAVPALIVSIWVAWASEPDFAVIVGDPATVSP